ncbi:hypothetical protein, conserved [Babesia ovata]|uniref:Extracellular matrix-binding ebh n=1 Tax=Babesia ovata TaxID=189622 RepID=A0A2H6KKB4_9APIC|nr:uncharacterized protein BOVATA_049230 [Babesia ovata]GBE63430.1 hypothetical protein, conserved [Babesia ovata]
MSFLHGVLSNIKPKLGLHKDDIQSAINALITHKHRGKEGFNAAISKVVEGVKQYNEGVKASNKKVSDVINTLQGQMTKLKQKVSEIHDSHSDTGAMDNKVKECLQQAQDFIDNIAHNSEHVSDLSDDLKRNVNSARDSIAYQRGELVRIHGLQAGQLKAVEQGVIKALRAAGTEINERIKKDVEALIKKWEQKLLAILASLREIDEKLQKYVKELQAWIEEAFKVIGQAEDRVREISDKANGGTGTKKFEIDRDLTDVGYQLGQKVSQLDEWNTAAGKVVDAALQNVRSILAQLTEDKKNAITTAVRRLKETGQQQLETSTTEKLRSISHEAMYSLENLGTEITTLVDDIVSHISNGSNTVQATRGYFNGYNVSGYFQQLDTISKQIIGTAKGTNGVGASQLSPSLQQLDDLQKRDAIMQLSQSFGNSHMQSQLTATNLQNLYTCSDAIKILLRNYVDSLNLQITNVLQNTNSQNLTDNTSPLQSVLGSAAAFASQLHTQLQRNSRLSRGRQAAPNLAGLEHASHLLSELSQRVNAFPAGINSLTQQLDSLALGITGPFTTLIQAVSKATNPPDGLKKQLETELKTDGLGSGSTWTIDKHSAKGLALIQKEIEKLKIHDVGNVLGNIAQFCSEITNESASANGHLNTLRESNIKVKLREIEKQISQLQKVTLTSTITTGDSFFKEADELLKNIIEALKQHVISQVQKAETAITQDLRAKYVTFMKAQLEAFAAKCQAELNELPAKITADADRGAKGFMKKMESIVGRLHKHDDVSVLSTNASVVITVLTDHVKTLLVRKTGIRSHVKLIYLLVHKMFEELGNSKHFDPTFTDNLHTLKSKLNDLTPKQFGEESTALLQSLKDGMTALTDVLSKCYINAYEGAKPIEKWTEPLTADQAKEKLTPDGERCAKACLTIVPIIRETLGELAGHLEKDDSAWRKYKMYTSTKQARSLHKEFFRENGYDITLSDSADSGELNHKDTFKAGEHVLFSPKSDPSAPGAAELDGISVEVSEEKGLIPELNSYHQLFLQHINSEFMVADKAEPTKKSVKPIEASPSNVTAPITVKALTKMCEKAYPVLTSILGNGHASGIYAVEFSNNSLKLYYPSSMVQLLSTLPIPTMQIWLRPKRLERVLVRQPNRCCPKSSPSTPCKTPMGFPEIAVTASHRNTGKHIYDVLRNFCSRSDKPLSQLCRYLQCLLHRTPQSLDDMWAFYYNFLTEWHGKGRRDEVGLKHKKEAFENAVNAANFKREYEGLKVQSILSTSHTSKSMGHPNGDLFSLICNSKLRGKCGPYLHSLTNDIAGIYSKKYAGRYLSWIVYLTQTFYSLLQSLYEVQ